jgi:5-(carboxyamino)imidazole ribonucleotide mutase
MAVKKTATQAAHVAVIMGSDSDLETMSPCMAVLESFGIPFIAAIASAHRTPKHLECTVKKFEAEGGRVVIAAAGGAAHLAGVVASLTPLPVIGVPIKSGLLGLDSLLSMAQMPPGVPVATVGVNGAKNAGLLAAQILALNSKPVRDRLLAFREEQAQQVIAKSNQLKNKGYGNYHSGAGRS